MFIRRGKQEQRTVGIIFFCAFCILLFRITVRLLDGEGVTMLTKNRKNGISVNKITKRRSRRDKKETEC